MILPMNAIINLDGWIQYYRTEPEGDCTTRDTLTFRWLSGQDTIVSETYRDYSCADFLDEGFTFWRATNIAETCCKKPRKKICKMYNVEIHEK